ncbi:uncharacterized protein LOC141729795 [Zonotrichia albicollis]|uniref:uncharacterized protein LOC141729795 n=1 Tax=Zonotrichia albicollis TaxID=44394 RepID=UPI003D80DDCD
MVDPIRLIFSSCTQDEVAAAIPFTQFPQTPQAVWSRKAPRREPAHTRWARRAQGCPRGTPPRAGHYLAVPVTRGARRSHRPRAAAGQAGRRAQRRAGEHSSGQAAGTLRTRSSRGGGGGGPAQPCAVSALRAAACGPRPPGPPRAWGGREGVRGRSAQPRGAGERGRTAPAPPAPASQRPTAFPPRTRHLGPRLRGLRRRLLLLHAFPASGTGQPFPGAGCSGGDRVTAAVALKGPSRHLPPGSARRLRGAAASPDPPPARPALRPPPPLRSRPREGPRRAGLGAPGDGPGPASGSSARPERSRGDSARAAPPVPTASPAGGTRAPASGQRGRRGPERR